MAAQNRIRVSIVVVALLLVFAPPISSRAATSAAPKQEPLKIVSSSPTPMPQFQEAPPQRSLTQPTEVSSHIGDGPFGPPDSNDTMFTQDSAPTMDEYRYRSQSPIEFPITIDRVVGKTDGEGYLLEPDKLIQNGIVSSKAHLQLLVWDVDEDYSGTDVIREIDKVYANGHYIGDLSGANQTWSVTRFDFDIRYLKFAKPTCNEDDNSHLEACHTSPTPVQNVIRIDIDTGNTGNDVWAVTVDWGAISFEAAHPILFVHGKGGSNDGGGYDYWDKYDGQYYFNFRGKFSSAGFLTAITENRLGGEVSIAENAGRLKTIINELKTRYGVRKVNLVGHSKGGLDSRGYISDSSFNSNNDVDALVTLASPHHGSYLADVAKDHPNLAGLLGNSQTDALRDVTEAYMNDTFNPSHPARQGVRYFAVAADSGQDYWHGRDIPIWQVLSLPEIGQRVGALLAWAILRGAGQYKGENDFLVTVNSTKWSGISGHNGSNSYHLGTYSLNHHSIRAAEKQAGQEDNTIADLVKSVLDIKSGSSGGWLQSQSGYEIESSATLSQTASTLGVLDGSINQGQTLNQVVGIDSSTFAGFTLLWQDGDLYLNLVAPNGAVIMPSTTITTVTYAEDRTGGSLNAFMAGKTCAYNVISPLAGQWTVQIVANASLPGGKANWALLTTQDSPVAISLATDQPWHKLNDQVTLAATLKNGTSPLLGANAQAIIVAPNGMIQTLSLYDNGTNGDVQANDGIYSNRFTATQFGTYRLSADTTGTVGAGISFKRTAVTELPVGSGAAAFTTGYSDYGIDTNSDGLYDILRINVPIAVTTAEQYGVVGALYDSNNTEMGLTDNTLTLTAGSNVLPLDFDGSLIATRGGQGIFALRDLRLIDKSTSQPLQVDYLSNAYATQSYSNGQFQRAAIALTGDSNDFGSDTNGNGKYDVLTMNIGVYLRQPLTYTWNARLIDANDYEFGWSSNSGYLSSGSNTISLVFDGKAISAHKVDGPYYLKDLALWSDNGYLNVINVAVTSAYSYIVFEPAVMRVYLPLALKSFGTPAWSSTSGLSGRTVYNIAPAPANCNTLYAATDAGIYKSADGGASWSASGLNAQLASQTLAPDAPHFGDQSASAMLVPAVAVDPANSQVVYAGTWGSGVYKSTNGGGTWTPVNTGLADSYFYALAVDPVDGNTVYAGANSGGVFKTANGGTSWTAANTGLGNTNIRSLAIAPGNRSVIYAGTTAGVYRSSNGAGSWSATGVVGDGNVWALALGSTDGLIVYAGISGRGVYQSGNSGTNWSAVNTGLASLDLRALAVDPNNASTVYAGTNGGGVFRSDSAGSTWASLNAGLGNLTVKSLAMDSGACHTLQAGTANGIWRYRP